MSGDDECRHESHADGLSVEVTDGISVQDSVPHIVIDFRFVDVEYELRALGKYLGILERELPRLQDELQDEERKRVRRELQDRGLMANDPEVDFALQEHYDLVNHVLPRFFRNPFVVMLWAVYESGVREVAERVRKHGGLDLGITDNRGGSFLDVARKYFHDLLELPLCSAQPQVWERIDMVMTLRHVIAHANGRIAATSKKARKKIKNWKKRRGLGVSVEHGNVVLSKRFVHESYEMVNAALRDLLRRAKAHMDEP